MQSPNAVAQCKPPQPQPQPHHIETPPHYCTRHAEEPPTIGQGLSVLHYLSHYLATPTSWIRQG